ncbi:hypothetical protein PR048_014100 [Dryococelus australis]|uniref:HAT C-terminal dimerisation domain-containing protein n=1 Tax=Dryococelus australis TaxID=614101 RepID=A0ABQ9HDA9_9NEOP|nr:hypothetical protein PR048_014100 [Dryococelus australis]
MVHNASQLNTDGLHASNNISLLIAKSVKSHTIGEKLILLAVTEALRTVLHKPPRDTIKTIPLGNNSVKRCMAENVEGTLCCTLRTTEFALQLETKNDTTLIKAKFVISAFIAKLTVFKRNVGRCELYQFPTLSELEHTVGLQGDDLQDLLMMEIPDWVINQFSDTEKVVVLEEELIELQNDIELKPKLKKSYEKFRLQKEIPDCYPALWRVVKKLLVAFPTSYLVERCFSVVSILLSKQ